MNQEDIKSMRVALDNMDDYAKMECSIDPIGAYKVLSAGIDMLESLSNQLTDCQRGRDEHNNFMQRNNQVVALYDNPAQSVPEWQPIETAPMLKTVLLAIENLQSLWTIAHNERSEAMLELAKERSACDQLGNALEEVAALALCGKKDQLPGRCDQITKIAYKTLKAWRAMK